MKRLTLNETWKLCLAMWKWIAGQKRPESPYDISRLKDQWLDEHGFGHKYISADCFFCEYATHHKCINDMCENCPGKMVNRRFSCENKSYEYRSKPIAFYNKLVSLNRKRKKK